MIKSKQDQQPSAPIMPNIPTAEIVYSRSSQELPQQSQHVQQVNDALPVNLVVDEELLTRTKYMADEKLKLEKQKHEKELQIQQKTADSIKKIQEETALKENKLKREKHEAELRRQEQEALLLKRQTELEQERFIVQTNEIKQQMFADWAYQNPHLAQERQQQQQHELQQEMLRKEHQLQLDIEAKRNQDELNRKKHERDLILANENARLQKQAITRIGKIAVCMALGFVVGDNI